MDKEKITMFVSFNCKSRDFVDSLEKKMPKTAELVRYENGVSVWGSFQKFMDTISEHNFAVLVISDDYLHSSACMYEVLTLLQDTDWKSKTMFVVMPGTNIYCLEDRIPYIQYWNDQYEHLKAKVETAGLPAAATSEINEEIQRVANIRDNMGAFLQAVSDSNNPRIFDAIDEICQRINISVGTRFQMMMNNGDFISMKQWSVLELLEQNPGLSSSKIANQLGLPRSTVYRILNNLIDQKLIALSEFYKYDKTGKRSTLSRTYTLVG